MTVGEIICLFRVDFLTSSTWQNWLSATGKKARRRGKFEDAWFGLRKLCVKEWILDFLYVLNVFFVGYYL